ncbi:MAG: cob(I)yrinic acid a,c-diamide adenosyltransferase [Acidobacteriota bacterium]|nr:cob(I)yrinic acid a,c-diamide adenosyltransferase [Blastocatellia bacterium]MDW8240464.1 cob(I)yrinic acid a,c-diamide adenosyltransferase [Acidobacteriota bacterium]
MRITRVYTRGGDGGETSLVDGQRVSKASSRVQAYGEIDELNSLLGVIRSESSDQQINQILQMIQNELFTVGADLASPSRIEVPRVPMEWVTHLEEVLDQLNEEVPPLEEFILPGGCKVASLLHVARTVARRAERAIVALSHEEQINPCVLPYINRLSDLLFVMARVVNKRSGLAEESAVFSQRGK